MDDMRGKAIECLQGILDEATRTEEAVSYVTKEDAFALRMAIEALKEQENTIVLGRDYWKRRFDITEKVWRTDDGEFVDMSFCITRKEENDDKRT